MATRRSGTFALALFVSSGLVVGGAQASPIGTSIGVNFGAVVGGGGPSGGSSAIPAGGFAGEPSVAQTNWNDTFPGTGTQANLIIDRMNVAGATSASVTWKSNGSSDPGGNDQFESATSGPPAPQNFELYQGYLDTDDNTTSYVTVQGLPAADFPFGYDLYVYFLGSVSARGGTYGVGPVFTPPVGDPNQVPTNTFQPNKLFNNQTGAWNDELAAFIPSGPEANGPEFLEDPGADFVDIGNYGVFRGLTASEFTLFATVVGDRTFGFGDRERAAISAIQIVAAVPEPGSVALLTAGAVAMLRRRRQ